MIVTKRWLEEFINLNDISAEKLCEVFNSIGLEVDSLRNIKFPDGVVVGEILSCEKHPKADKLNICQVNVGSDIKQIVCGASNVVNAKYVAVALEGTVLPEIDLEIKPVCLREIDSYGMICSSTELGLPKIEDGIMILDDSIGKLVAGKRLNEYPNLSDSIIELELTANRGDCLSVYGVARDLSAYFNRPLKNCEYKPKKFMIQGIARSLRVRSIGTFKNSKLLFNIVDSNSIKASFLTKFRVALIGKYIGDELDANLKCTIHSIGVILRAYDFEKLSRDGKVSLTIDSTKEDVVEIKLDRKLLSHVGISSNSSLLATDKSNRILLEASYIAPEMISKVIHEHKFETDELYYLTSRGTNSNLEMGLVNLYRQCDENSICLYGELPIKVEGSLDTKVINVNIEKLNSIIGTNIDRKIINSILNRLGFTTHGSNSQNVFGAVVPPWRHDIDNIQDVAEEIMRIAGIDNVPPKPLPLEEKNRLTSTTLKYRVIRDLRQRTVAKGFFEVITYAFSDKDRLKKYQFMIIDDEVDLANPIVDELNTLRSTIVINLLDAVKRNISYGKKRVPLFEVGAVFDKNRDETLKFAIVESGFSQDSNILNQAKPEKTDFATFVEKLSSIVGEFEIKNATPKESLFHPYQYGRLYIDNKEIGYVAKIHPKAQEEWDIPDTFVAEMSLEAILPKHKNASFISNFQGVYKDLSLLISIDNNYEYLYDALKSYKDELIKRYFIIDLYEDNSFGDKKSITIRFFLQSDKQTLSDKAIEKSMSSVLEYLKESCQVELR